MGRMLFSEGLQSYWVSVEKAYDCIIHDTHLRLKQDLGNGDVTNQGGYVQRSGSNRTPDGAVVDV